MSIIIGHGLSIIAMLWNLAELTVLPDEKTQFTRL